MEKRVALVLAASLFITFAASLASAASFTLFNNSNAAQAPYFTVNGSTGYVGIGTSSPAGYFQINGNSTMKLLGVGYDSGYTSITQSGTPNNGIWWQTPFYFSNGGFIGNANSGGFLRFESGANISISNAADNKYVRFSSPNTGVTIGQSYYGASPPTNGLIVQGNVGIGTATPSMALDVRGAGNFSGTIYLKNGTEIFSYINTVTAGNSSGGTTNATDTYVPYMGSSKNVVLGAYNFTVDTNVLHVDATNNRVGVKTTNPISPLHVAETAGAESGDYLVNYRFPNDGSINNKTLLLFPIPNVASGGPLSKMNGVLSLARGSTASSPRNNNYYVSATYSYGGNPEVSITPLSTWDPVLRAVECTYNGEQYLTLNLTHIYADWPGTSNIYFTGYYANNNNSQRPEVIDSSLCTSPAVLKDVNSFGGSISVDNSGNVGIETTSPAARLDVNGNARIQGIGNFSGTVYINNGTDLGAFIAGNGTGTYVPYTGANSNVNLGVYNLTTTGYINANGGLVQNLAGDSSSLTLRTGVTSGVQSSIVIRDSWNGANNNNAYISFNTGTGSSSVERMRINGSNGNVGIGTATPSQKLDVRGDGNFSGTIYLKNGTEILSYINTNIAGNSSGGTTNATETYVPYTGASKAVNIGSFNLSANGLDIATGAQFGSGHVNLIDSTGKIAGISSTYFASLDGSALTNLNAGNIGSGTLATGRLSTTPGTYAIDPVMSQNGVAHSTLGSATIGEIAISDLYTQNKIQFAVPYSVDYTADGTTWDTYPYASANSSTIRNMFLGYSAGQGIKINGTESWRGIRLIFEAKSYSYLNNLYIYQSTNGHSANISIYKSWGTDINNMSVVASNSSFNGWPGHTMITHSTIAWNNNPTPGTHSKYVAVYIFPNWNPTYPNNNIDITSIDWWGQYPANNRPAELFGWDYNQNVNFNNGTTWTGTGAKLGVGTSSPQAKLEVWGDIATRSDSDDWLLQYSRLDGTQNGGIRTFNNNNPQTGLAFYTMNTSRIAITRDGNVGIGTTTPSRALDVRGAGNFSGTVYVNNNTDVLGLITSVNATATTWNVSGSNLFPEDLAYNVGIGTASPARKLEVNGSVRIKDYFEIINSQNSVAAFALYNSTANNAGVRILYNDSTNPRIILRNLTDSNKVIIDSEGNSYFAGGNVGIGTDNPQARLHAFTSTSQATTLAEIARFTRNMSDGDIGANNDGGYIGFYVTDTGTTNIEHARLSWRSLGSSENNGYLGLWTSNSAGTPTERLSIDSSGRVGIGTTAPSNTLDVRGAGNFSGTVYINNNTDVVAVISSLNSSVASSDDWNVSGNYLFPKDLNYRVGIGTATPSSSLDVEGRTTQFSNTGIVYRWYFGGAQDTNWKGIANVSFGAGVYEGASFKIELIDAMTNAGGSVAPLPMTYYAYMRGNDAGNLSAVSGPFADYVRVVKTDAGKYELQVRQIADWRHMQVEVQQISTCCGTAVVSYQDTPNNGSITGTIYNASTQDTKYFANLAARGNITTVGSLGVGVTSPNQSKLQVYGNGLYEATIRLTNTASGGGDWSIISTDSAWGAGGGKLLFASPSPASAYARMAIDSNGNVGIGTANPARLLTLTSSADTYALLNTSNANADAQIIFENSGDANNAWSIGRENSGGFRIIHSTGSSYGTGTSTTRMQIDPSGNVGIGTTTPSMALDVRGAGNFSGTVFINNGTDISTLVDSAAAASPFSNTSSQIQIRAGFPSTLNISNLLFANATNVGIGTTSPTSQLHLAQGTGDKTFIQLQNTGGTIGDKVRLMFTLSSVANGAGAEIVAERLGANAQSALEFFTNNAAGASTERMRIDNNGNLGINTTSPQAKLHVQGDVILNASATGGNVIIQL